MSRPAGVLADSLPSNGGGGHETLDAQAWSSEAKFLLLLSAPACVQLCTQQGLVVTNQARGQLVALRIVATASCVLPHPLTGLPCRTHMHLAMMPVLAEPLLQ